MELICPSCEARYQVPDGAIGEKGRQVSCMNCGHGWHAYPPLMLGARAATGIDAGRQPTPRAVQGTAQGTAPAAMQFVEAGSGEPPRRPAGSRSDQLAEIREMLAEVQSEDRGAPAGADAPGTDGAAPPGADALRPRSQPASPPARTEAPADAEDPLRQRLRQHDRETRRPRETNVERLRKRHERRERRHQRAVKAGSGGFVTGLLLVVMVAAIMVALYLLKPQIVAQMPGADPALTEYVETIDGMRVTLAETATRARDWVADRAGRFL